MIEIKDLTFSYNNTRQPSLKNINLKIRDGEFVLITGPSGSGKSTLVRTLNALIPNFYGGYISGAIKVQNLNPLKLETRVMAEKVGMIFQNPENQVFMNDVESEIAFGMENLNFPTDVMQKKVKEMLNSFRIIHLRKKQTTALSGGEKQKIAIASVIAMEPEILILDEPTAELDPQSAEEVLNLVQSLNKKLGLTVILIEHRLDRVVQFVDRVILMDRGSIIKKGTPEECFYDGTDLDNLGIEIPPVIKVFRKLKRRNPDLKGNPLTVEECGRALKSLFGSVRINPVNLDMNKIPNENILIEFKNVWFSYNKNKKENMILKDISFKVCAGEFISIIGRNGSGKTTLVKHIIGLLRPNRGKIFINNEEIGKKSVADISRSVGYIFQNPSIQFYQDSLEEEISFVLKNFGYQENKIEKLVTKVLEQFKLSVYRKKYARYLSIGEQQKAALATVLSLEPKILILDEPTHGMDYGQKSIFMRFLDEYRIKGNAVILITHDVETIAEFSDRVILLSDGKISEDGVKRDVLSNISNTPIFSPQVNRLVRSFDNIPKNILTADELLEVLETK
ncbi:MAG: ABC transporter ATP-binding protein [Promethearchaeota archaeon]